MNQGAGSHISKNTCFFLSGEIGPREILEIAAKQFGGSEMEVKLLPQSTRDCKSVHGVPIELRYNY